MSTRPPTPAAKRTATTVAGAASTLVRAWLRGELARRLGRLAMLAAAFTALVLVLYAKGETPTALAGSAVPLSARAAGATAARAAVAPRGTGHAGRGGRPGLPTAALPAPKAPAAGAPAATPGTGTAAPAVTPGSPAAVAIAWYAAREHLAPGKVRALQQDRRADHEVRVLVLADAGNGKLTTALVTVHRDGTGRWSP
jgi:hypothetical protein